jgi:hypothetical protein
MASLYKGQQKQRHHLQRGYIDGILCTAPEIDLNRQRHEKLTHTQAQKKPRSGGLDSQLRNSRTLEAQHVYYIQ